MGSERAKGEGNKRFIAMHYLFSQCKFFIEIFFSSLESILVLQFQMKNLGRMTSAEELN